MTTRTIVENYLDYFALGEKNPALLKPILKENLHFKSPLGEFFTADSFLQDLKRNVLDIREVKINQIIADDTKACALYEVQSHDPEIGNLMFSEWFQIDQGQISKIESTYDATGIRRAMMQI